MKKNTDLVLYSSCSTVFIQNIDLQSVCNVKDNARPHHFKPDFQAMNVKTVF